MDDTVKQVDYSGAFDRDQGQEEYLPGDEGQSVGSILRQARERLGYDLEHVARVLCVKNSFVEKIEDGRLEEIPYGDAYVIPFVRSYGEYLGLGDLDELCIRTRHDLMPLYLSIKILDQGDVRKVGDTPGDDRVSVWDKERFARKSAQHKSRVWIGVGVMVAVVLALLSWRFYQMRMQSQETAEDISAISQQALPSAADVASEPLIKIRALNTTLEVYVFGPDGVVYDSVLEAGRSITLPQESGLRFSISPSTGWELLVNGEKVPQDIALSSSSLDEIADKVRGG